VEQAFSIQLHFWSSTFYCDNINWHCKAKYETNATDMVDYNACKMGWHYLHQMAGGEQENQLL
jgi:hypothetical protein